MKGQFYIYMFIACCRFMYSKYVGVGSGRSDISKRCAMSTLPDNKIFAGRFDFRHQEEPVSSVDDALTQVNT
jgi:hypothetical protein